MLRIAAIACLLLASPAWGGVATQRVDAARIVAAARAVLDRQLGNDSATAEVTVIGTPEDIQVGAGTVALQARPAQGRWPRSRVGIAVDVSVDGKVTRAATVWFALGVHRTVLSYADDALADTLASSLKFGQQDVDVAALAEAPVSDPRQLDGRRLRHPVLAGAPVLAGDFERVPDVDRKGRVEVNVVLGSIHMQTKGTSSSVGNVGDLVTVLVDGAEAPVRARVTEKGVVDVVQ